MIGEADGMPSMMMDDGTMDMMEGAITYMQGERTKLDLMTGSMKPKPTHPRHKRHRPPWCHWPRWPRWPRRRSTAATGARWFRWR